MTYSIISLVLEKDTDGKDILIGWFFNNTNYKEFKLKGKKLTFLQQMKKEEFESLNHFIGVMGKFDEFQIFFDPIEVSDLDFISLLPLI